MIEIDYENLTKEQVIEILDSLQKHKHIRIIDYTDQITVKLKPSLSAAASNGVEQWIDEYRKMFYGKKPGAMGDRASCINKMQEFMQQNTQFTKEIILKATIKYITGCNNYTYLMKADNFISVSKDNTKAGRRSELFSYCEEVINNINSLSTDLNNEIRKDYGRSI